MCLREIDQWSCGMDATTTLAQEEEFLRGHLGSWAGEYCAQAERYTRTEFYRGFLAILGDFIRIEMEYLQQNPTSIFYKNPNQ